MKVAKTMRVQLALSLPREEISVPLTRHVVSAALTTAGVEPTCVHDVEVALSEACTNAVQHAVEGVTYEVMVGISDEQVAIDVIDRALDPVSARPPRTGLLIWPRTGMGST